MPDDELPEECPEELSVESFVLSEPFDPFWELLCAVEAGDWAAVAAVLDWRAGVADESGACCTVEVFVYDDWELVLFCCERPLADG